MAVVLLAGCADVKAEAGKEADKAGTEALAELKPITLAATDPNIAASPTRAKTETLGSVEGRRSFDVVVVAFGAKETLVMITSTRWRKRAKPTVAGSSGLGVGLTVGSGVGLR